ncbi:MAG: glycosyltransferase [Phycisphaerales bacterium]|jgi:GT2 family glycosyltransferase
MSHAAEKMIEPVGSGEALPRGDRLGAVVIGRNEGDRLPRCLRSILEEVPASRIVYVDSGSTDRSVECARALGVEVHELDPIRPFSAARARNEGFERLLAAADEIELVQFVDGDCEVVRGWFGEASRRLAERPDLAAVCGRTVERDREASIYNRLCDIEFDVPAGEAKATGGIFLMRADAYRGVGGMREDVVAGEEPEMGLRLRRSGWRIERLARPMVLHDSAMTRFSQWWRRAVRSGVGYSLGAHLHGRSPDRFCVREVRRFWVWGLLIPLLAIALAWPTWGLSVAAYLLLLATQWSRIAWRSRRRGLSVADASIYAVSCVLAKFAGIVGVLRFRRDLARGRVTGIVEYK